MNDLTDKDLKSDVKEFFTEIVSLSEEMRNTETYSEGRNNFLKDLPVICSQYFVKADCNLKKSIETEGDPRS